MTGMRTVRLRGFATAAASIALAILAMPAVGARQAAEPRPGMTKSVEAADTSRRQPFSVVLLLGDMQGGESLEGVPAAARKALADTKDFLPYKNYRLLDSQWTLCCSGSTSAITRIRGLDDQHYELELRATPIFDSKSPVTFESLSVRFFLRELEPQSAISTKSDGKNTALETRVGQINAELFSLEREQVSLSGQVTSLRKGVEVGTKDPADLKRADEQLTLVNRRIAILKNELNSMTSSKTYGGSKAVMDTSFRIEVGETVVVGTSGLKGGSKALIALLTAVGKRPKS